MHNIALSTDFGNFYRSVVSSPFGRRHYGALSFHSLALPRPAFVLYATVAALANFRTRIADLRWRRGQLRSWRSGRQIRRLLTFLEDRFLVRYGRGLYSLRGRTEHLAGSRIRPVNMHLLRRVRDERTALYVQFMLWLAWCRRPWDQVELSDVADGLRIRRETAAGLLYWLRTEGLRHGQKALRRVVFYSVRPEWWKWTRRRARGQDPRRRGAGDLAEFPFVRQGIEALAFASSFSGALTGTGPRPAGSAGGVGGRPAEQLAGNVIGRRDAARVLKLGRGMFERLRRGKAPAVEAPLEGKVRRRPGGPAITVDELVAALPQQVRDQFRRSHAGKALRYLEAVDKQRQNSSSGCFGSQVTPAGGSATEPGRDNESR